MSTNKQSTSHSKRKLLTAKERSVCQKVAASDAGLASRRAVALLTINDGLTHAKASEQSGLKPDQIKYLMTTFRKKRLSLFPDDVLSDSQPLEGVGKKDKKSKVKKGKKTKNRKKTKKEKKVKKGKKTKKAKKEDKKGKKVKKGKKTKKVKTKDKKAKKAKRTKGKKRK